jgi:hypothetical protein
MFTNRKISTLQYADIQMHKSEVLSVHAMAAYRDRTGISF